MESKEFWNSRAEYYKENNEVSMLPPSLTLANMLEIYEAEDIVEVACATGVFTMFYLCNLERAKTFISVDVSDVMIKLAEERKANTMGINKKISHEFKVGDAQELNFLKDQSIDIYVSTMCLHLVSDKAKFLKEARRVLKRGGKIGLTVPCREDGMIGLFVENIEKVAPTAGPFPWHLFSFGYKDKMVELLQENGFQVRYC